MAENIDFGGLMLIALGSNATQAGMDSETLIRAVIERLAERMFPIRHASRLYRSPAFPAGSGPDYVNAAVAVTSTMSPRQAMEALHAIEAEFGRKRRTRWAQRTLDLDLLAVGSTVLPDEATQTHWRGLSLDAQMKHAPDELILPHPRLQDRAFVLQPLADVAPEWRHPILGQSVTQMRDALPADQLAALQVI